ncbi:MAG TPA: DNA translocase FtsK 4TM domain-containing protein, partial [Candidatus Saccharimonadales bacterium]|nr:DNA translocase FtsK 4TM domain-containing protein [Candidatus Saccharimonadales bacterium]
MKQKLIAYLKHYVRLYGPVCLMIFSTIIVFLSLQSFRPDDVSFFYHATGGTCRNTLGYFGATLAAFLVYLLGTSAYFVPFLMMYTLLFMMGLKKVWQEFDRIVGVGFFVILSSALCHFYEIGYYEFSGAGGVVGSMVMKFLSSFDVRLKAIVLWTLLFASTVLIARFAHLIVARWILHALHSFFSYVMKVDNLPARAVRAVATGISIICFSL